MQSNAPGPWGAHDPGGRRSAEYLAAELICLLDEGKIEFHKVGTHRRVPFKSALAYKRQIYSDRKSALAEFAAYDQELGI